jgi:peptidyl-prolyl cis-trans isomerase C
MVSTPFKKRGFLMFRFILSLVIILVSSASSYADETAVAKVNGDVLTSRDLDTELDRLVPRTTFHGGISKVKREEFRDKALQNLIDHQLQYQDAVAKGMKPDKKQVKARMGKIRDRFESKKEYKKALEKLGVTEDELRSMIARDILIQDVTAKTVEEPAQVNEAELRQYYDKNIAMFKQPEAVKLMLISMKDKKKARAALKKIKSGEDFSAVAEKMSEDDYRVKGGDFGYIHRGRLKFPIIENEAFRLKAGEMSGLLQADGTWFIIKSGERKPELQLSFEQVKNKLKMDLEAQRTAGLMEKWMAGLRAKAKIEVLPGKSEKTN